MFDWRYWRDREPRTSSIKLLGYFQTQKLPVSSAVLWMVLACSCSTNFRILLLHSEHIKPPIDRGPREAPGNGMNMGPDESIRSILSCLGWAYGVTWFLSWGVNGRELHMLTLVACVRSLGSPFCISVGWESVSHVSLCFISSPSIPGWRHANAAVGDGTLNAKHLEPKGVQQKI